MIKRWVTEVKLADFYRIQITFSRQREKIDKAWRKPTIMLILHNAIFIHSNCIYPYFPFPIFLSLFPYFPISYPYFIYPFS